MFIRSRTLINDLFSDSDKYLNTDIRVCGWIETMRVQGAQTFGFLSLNDGSCLNSLQVIINIENDEIKNEFDGIFSRGTKGVSIRVEGKLIESPAEGQSFELQAHVINVYGDVNAKEYPIAKKKLTLEHIRKFLHLRVRTKVMASVARVRNICSMATHNFFQKNGFKYVHTPLITGNDCEGAGETFNLVTDLSKTTTPKDQFFGKNVNLAVSGQLNGEAYATGLSDIYTFGPTFRAENSNTTRHLAEFWMIEPELCFVELKDIMDLAEDYLKYCVNDVLTNCREELELFQNHYAPELIEDLTKIVGTDFVRISYKDAIDKLLGEMTEGKAIVRDKTVENKKFKKLAKGKHVFEEKVYFGCDMASEHEKYLTTLFGGPIIVYNYPKDIKSFYMKKNDDGVTVQAMDLLIPKIGELMGGSMREENYEKLESIMNDKGMNTEALQWYLDLRKYGTVPHGGFGLGFERLILLVTGLTNIRDVIPFPRYPKHCEC